MNIKKIIKEIMYVISGSFVAAIATKYFIIPLKLLTGGVYGLSLLITRAKEAMETANFDALYFSKLYLVLNLPLLVWGYHKVGKKIILYTLAHIVTLSLFVGYLPNSIPIIIDREILKVIIGAWLFGIASALIYKGNGSTGGLDIVSIHITKIRNELSVSNINSLHTYALFLVYQYVFYVKFGTPLINQILILSIVFSIMQTIVANMVYRRHKIILCTVVAKDHEKLMDLLHTEFAHKGYSMYDIEGRLGKKRVAVHIVLSYYEAKELIRLLDERKIKNFFYTTNVWRVHKNFTALK